MSFNINDFLSSTKEGLARDAHFDITFTLPAAVQGDARNLSLLCTAASLPTRQTDFTTIRRSGTGLMSPYAIGLSYSPLDVTLYCDTKGNSISTIQKWMDLIMETGNIGNMWQIEYKANYATGIELMQYAPDGQPMNKYSFSSAFPVSFGPVNFSWASRNSLVLVPATFVYNAYNVNPVAARSANNISTTPQNAQNNRLPATGNTPV